MRSCTLSLHYCSLCMELKLYSFNCYLLCFCFCPQMWRSGTLRPDIIGELHLQVTQNLHVATELFHEVDIDGEGIRQVARLWILVTHLILQKKWKMQSLMRFILLCNWVNRILNMVDMAPVWFTFIASHYYNRLLIILAHTDAMRSLQSQAYK